MKDIADDLLDDLQELESSTDELETHVEKVVQNQKILNQHTGETAMESAVLMLESSKIAQDASLHSQESAEINLKLAKEQQMQIDDLQQANNSWRQAIRNANEEIKSSKGFFIAVFVLSLITSLGVSGVVGWYLFNDTQKHNQLKQDIMDIIQTETTINQRQMNLKIDELASVMENLAIPAPVNTDQPEVQNEPTQGSELADPKVKMLDLASAADKPTPQVNKDVNTQPAPKQVDQQMVAINQSLEQMLSEQKQIIEQIAARLSSDQAPQTPVKEGKVESVDLSGLNEQFARLEKMLNTQTAKIENLSKQVQIDKTETKDIKVSKTQELGNLELKNQLRKLSDDFAELKKQQSAVQNALDKLTQTLNKAHEEQANEPKPYSYRNPYEYKN